MPHQTAAIFAHILCAPYNYAPVYSVTLFKATYVGGIQCHFIQSHICKRHVCLAVTCHLHFWQNDRDLFTCYCGNTGVEQILKWESAQKVDPGEENSPAIPQTGSLSIVSLVLYHSAIPTPHFHSRDIKLQHDFNIYTILGLGDDFLDSTSCRHRCCISPHGERG